MNDSFEKYIEDVKSILSCNQGNEKISYMYTEEQIDECRNFFYETWFKGISSEQAMKMFYFYSEDIEEDNRNL